MAESHIRIDEGIKRGPRKAQDATRRSPKADLGTWLIPADLNPHDVLQRYLTEETTSQVAGQYGLSRKALVKWLRATVPNEWKEIQLIRAHANLEQGEDGIQVAEDANSAISLACARERIKAAQWRLQSLDKDYAPKQEVTVTNVIQIETILDGHCDELLRLIGASYTVPLQPVLLTNEATIVQVIDNKQDPI